MARSSCDNSTVHYMLPNLVSKYLYNLYLYTGNLCVTSCFHIHVRRDIDNNDLDTMLEQLVKISNVFARRLLLLDFVIVCSGSK